jgi:DNA repair protein RecN (Recombination protein N)
VLVELAVEGLGVIDATELELDRGCSALTGETGAGKTLLVAALGLLLGGRSDRALVRDTSRAARVEGRFELPAGHAARSLLAEQDLGGDLSGTGIEELIVVRTIGPDGRSKARVNGRIVPLGVLSELGDTLVEIAGQHEHARIASPAVQRTLLDAYAGTEAVAFAAQVAEEVATASSARRHVDRLADDERSRARERDSLDHEIAEIEAASIAPGESEALAADVARIEHAEAIASAASVALEALRGERGVSDLLEGAHSEIAKLEGLDPGLGAAAERLRSAAYEIDDVALELARSAVPADPQRLDEARARLDLLRRLQRKYGNSDGEVLAYLERARSRRAELEGAEEERSRWEAQRDAAVERAGRAAQRLGELRRAAAEPLARELESVLGDLALSGARVEVRLGHRDLYEGGRESVGFWIAANPGEELHPAVKVASGGELARIALALYLVSVTGGPETMIFDEVDAGVGGEAAQSVGRSLARLAARTGGQVLVVTHLPQVAAFADAHYCVTKSASEGRTVARVRRVDGEDRIAELSRMLAGLPESERARSHAEELLELGSAR